MPHVLSPEAEAELDEIWLYLAQESGNPNIADRFLDSLVERFYLLALNPRIGRRRDEDLRPGVRSFPIGGYIILYRLEGEAVTVLHVVHGNRDLEALFGR